MARRPTLFLPALLGLAALGPNVLARGDQEERRPAPPTTVKLKRAFVRWRSGESSPRPDFNIHVYVYPGTQRKVESNERGGSILGYESRDRQIPIAGGAITELPLQGYTDFNGYAGVAVPLDKETFTRLHGGHFRLNCYWKGGPDLWMNDVQLVFEYEDGSVQRVGFPKIKEGSGAGAFDYYFDDGFRTIQP